MKERFDIHQHTTNQIVAAIERGATEFHLPWHSAGGASSDRSMYRGVNIFVLWAASEQNLASWLSVLKTDKRAIFTAALKASEAASFLASLSGG